MSEPFRWSPAGREYRHEVLTCRGCGYRVDAATDPAGGRARPTDGSFSVCLRCTTIAVYAVTALGVVTLRPPTDAETDEFRRSPTGARLVRAIERMWEHRGGAPPLRPDGRMHLDELGDDG